MRTRIGWASAIAVLGLALTLALAGTQAATAVQGEAVVAGQTNTATNTTTVQNTSVSVSCTPGGFGGLLGCGSTGVSGYGTSAGVYGSGSYGLFGQSFDAMGVGVYGQGVQAGVQGITDTGSGGDGVYGRTDGSGSGVYGDNPGSGNGVLGHAISSTGIRGETETGVGVLAIASNGGKALKVTGKAQFSRSGKAIVLAGQSSVTVSNVGLSAKSLVLATAQKSVAGAYVQAAVPDTTAKTITIYLSGVVNANYPVAWFIIERP